MNCKVLLLDDDLRYLELLQIMLEEEKMEVFTSTRCSDLSNMIEINRPDVVVMDILMHEENGMQVVQHYRETNESDRTPIIFVSAWTGAGEHKLPSNSTRLFKPFSHFDLLDAIERALESKAEPQEMQ